MTNENDPNAVSAVELATELTVAWLSNQNTRTDAEHVPAFLASMHAAIVGLSGSSDVPEGSTTAEQQFAPAVSVRKSLSSSEHIISMIDGKPYKTLRRHLSTHGLTPEEYRARYNLKADYPMVAQSYSESRRAMAKKIGLGRKPGIKAKAPAAKSKSGRSAKAEPNPSGE